MKVSTPETIKFRRLERLLQLPRYQVVGILESLWILTARDAPDGAIGKFSDEDIAAIIDWDGSAASLVDSLVASGFLDRCREHRLVVHDWADHAPTWVRGSLARYNRSFVKVVPMDAPKEAPQDATTKSSLVLEDNPQTPFSSGKGAFFSLANRGDAWRTWCEAERCDPEQLAAQLEVTKDWTDAELIAAVTNAMANPKRSRLARPKPDEPSPVQSGKQLDDDDRAAERERNQIIRRGRTLKQSPEQIDAALIAAGCEPLNGKPAEGDQA